MTTLFPTITQICEHTDRILWDAYDRSTGNHRQNRRGYLEFPQRCGVALRVSEQEARFAFVESICQKKFRYSVEVPTQKCYRFSGKSGKKQAAQTDLQVHEWGEDGVCNVEFKATRISPRANCKTKKPIYKDVEKLLREPVRGLWFHLFESVNRATIPNLLCVIAEQIRKVKVKYTDIDALGLTIHICVLRERFSLQKDVPLCLNYTDLIKHFGVEYRVSKGMLTEIHNLNGWCLTRE